MAGGQDCALVIKYGEIAGNLGRRFVVDVSRYGGTSEVGDLVARSVSEG